MTPSVLIVDDVPEMRDVLRVAFERAGFQVSEAGNGRDVADRVAREQFDVVVLDVLMPGYDGLETLQDLRRCGSSARVIAVSGGGKVAPENYLHLALQLGADAALAKPIRPDQAVSLARRLIAPREPPGDAGVLRSRLLARRGVKGC